MEIINEKRQGGKLSELSLAPVTTELNWPNWGQQEMKKR
jgi:hypothetical protein